MAFRLGGFANRVPVGCLLNWRCVKQGALSYVPVDVPFSGQQSHSVSRNRSPGLHLSSSMQLSSRFLAVVFLAALPSIALAQPKVTPGRAKVEEATRFQMELGKGKVSLQDVLERWRSLTHDPVVQKDKDALAIAYACEGLVEKERGELDRADSLLEYSMPLFQLKASKAYFLVQHALLKKSMRQHKSAIDLYAEILSDYDSLPQLREIKFYAGSGYPDLAYAIDAARNLAEIALVAPGQRARVISLLTSSLKKHPADQLGLMNLVALELLDKEKAAQWRERKEKLLSAKPEFADLGEVFKNGIK